MTEEWKEHQNHVLAELKRLNECYNRLDARMIKISEDLSGLKVKARIWGAFGGAIPIIIGLGIWFLRK